MSIGEFPDEKAAASAILAAAAGGSLSEIETTVAMTAKDAAATFESAGKAAKGFRSAAIVVSGETLIPNANTGYPHGKTGSAWKVARVGERRGKLCGDIEASE